MKLRYLKTTTYRRAPCAMRACIVIVMVLLLLSWNYGVRADGAPGDLDPGFGTHGKVMTDLIVDGHRPYGLLLSALALQPDGKLIAAGAHFNAFVLMRYNADGSLDATFGEGGRVVTDLGPNFSLPYGIFPDVRLSAAGRIVVATKRFISPMKVGRLMACYNADGKLDTSFGDGGTIRDDSSFANDLLAQDDLLVQADGRIFATANSGLVRFNADGTRDMSFGSGGQVTVSNVSIFQLTQQSDGRIIGAGTSSFNGFALARFLSDGSLDPSFGTAGVVTTEPGSGEVRRVLVAADGQIVAVGGPREWNNPFHLVVAKYNADGSLDTAFANGGILTSDLYGPPNGLAVQPDGHIVIGVYSSAADFELIRFTPNGGVDLSFGNNGRARADFSGRWDSVSALAAVGNERIVAAGSSYTVNSAGFLAESCFALACFMTSGTPHANPDFELGFTSSVIHATPGTRPRIEVNLTRIGGFSGEVTVTPPDPSAEGIICKAPAPATVSGITASWKFRVRGWAAPGPHQLRFVGRDATGRERSATVTLIVD